MGKYKTFGSRFDRVHRNDLNANFAAVETDINAQKTRVDDLIKGTAQPSEVVDSRGGFPVLRDRLDDLSSSLAQNVSLIDSVDKAQHFSGLVEASNLENIMKANWQAIEKVYEKNVAELLTTDTKNFLAFATIEHVGSEIWVMYRRGTDHTSPDGKIELAKSSDDGVTWTITTLLETAGVDYRDPNLIKAPNGNVVLRYFKTIAGGNPVNSVWFKVYNVSNSTWGNEIATPLPNDYTGNVACRGNGTIVDGKLLFANYTAEATEKVFIVESADNGLTWTFKSYISKDDYNETSVCYLNGKVYAVLRDGSYIDTTTYKDYRNRLYISVSNDKGLTWSAPKALPVWGHAPTLEALNGRMIMTYRSLNSWDNKDGKTEVNLVMLRDTGVDSPIINLLWTTGILDLGYTDVKVKGDYTYIVYHLYASPRRIVFYKVANSYLNGLNILNKKTTTSNFISSDMIYKNSAGTVSTKNNIKIIAGDLFVQGDGTDKKAFTITLDKDYTILNATFTVKNSSGAFIVNLDSYTTNTINAVLKVITSTFSSQIQVFWQAIVV
jgi:hypothetical protein